MGVIKKLRLLLVLLVLGCNKDLSKTTGHCTSSFCSAEGAKTLVALQATPFESIPQMDFQVQIVLLGNVLENKWWLGSEIKTLVKHLNTAFQGSNIQFVWNEKLIRAQGFEPATIESLQEDIDTYQQLIALDKPKHINIYILPSSGQINGSTLVLSEAFDQYPIAGLNTVLIAESAFLNKTTLSHELGHFFGLQHTFGKKADPYTTTELPDGSNCLESGDFICDTPADPNEENKRCDDSQNRLKIFKPHTDNYMSYYPSPCKKRFTQQQKELMGKFAHNFRNYLL
ncbi:MAG: M43 family zinc metalloprotease [Flavobacteriaceae bacterium]|nr:M43 family zinc metalloprotease [Flavobacteriaceae bacterium]